MQQSKANKSVKPSKKQGNKKKKKEDKIPYHRRPEDMSMEMWQIGLRRQFVESNDFEIKKISPELVYADYNVSNPASRSTYKVALRSADHRGHNFCSCYDFRVSRLGTCKHVEAVLRHIVKRRLKKHLKTPVERPYTSVYLDYRSGKQVRLRIGSEHREAFETLAGGYFDPHGCLTAHGFSNFEMFLQQAFLLSEQFRCYDDALEHILEQREHQRRIQKVQHMSPTERQAWLAGLVKADVFPYQQEGLLFAYQHGRVIIGDEMGLGKTVQAIAAAQLLRREMGLSKVLILAPTSLKYQWKTELKKFADEEATVVEGVATVRHNIHRNGETVYKIASYHSALYDSQAMDEAGYDLVILDEAQRIKNWRTKIAQSVRRVNSRHVFVLTGTPIENNLEELYGLVQFVDPFALGPRHVFFPRYQTTDDNGRVIGYDHLGEIRQLLADRLIRRTKREVLKQLPKRTDKNLVVPMTQQQREMHREFADQVAKLVLKWQRMKFLDEQDRQKLLKNLSLMRMVCDSTYIVDQSTNYQTKVDELLNILQEILEIEGEKVVVFSQWARMNDLVVNALDSIGVSYRYLHGSVPGRERGALYTEFNENPEVRVFVSTDAGGVGLNLQSAAWLINLDIPWNPGILEQRIGRIYRLGQEKPVNIINLVAQESIEHNMLGVIQFKKGVAEGVLDGGEETIFMGDSKFKQFMASVETITRDTMSSMSSVHVEDMEPPATQQPDHTDEDAMPAIAATPATASADLPDDLDVADESPASAPTPGRPSTAASPESLVQNGLQFFTQLARTLNDREATEQLVKTIVQKDEKSGQTYVRLPVENEKAVEGMLNLLGGLLKAVSGA
ncbi:MAG TPA: DEAD/DEAH box helicase [Saprospiraceae bacterium]|nr:DEAD/DEAH box helicase [Saprospiraceae bacterium]